MLKFAETWLFLRVHGTEPGLLLRFSRSFYLKMTNQCILHNTLELLNTSRLVEPDAFTLLGHKIPTWIVFIFLACESRVEVLTYAF